MDERAAQQGIGWRMGLWALLMGLALVIALSIILTFQFLPKKVRLEEGDVSPEDVLAPLGVTYVSELKTEEERDKAEAAVEDVYDPADAKIARQQVTRARLICNYIDSVRHDGYADPQRKKELIEAIPDLDFSPTAIDDILSLDDQSWEMVVNEVLYVLDQVMREEIRENQLIETRRKVPSLISLGLSEKQAEIASELVKSLIVPNSFYNAEKTEESRAKAREGVKPVRRTIAKGEAILREGDIVTPLHLEALEALGLRQRGIEWRDILGTILFVVMIVSALESYLLRFRPGFWANQRQILLLSFIIILSVLAAKLMVPGHTVLPYLLPLASMPMLLTALLGPHVAMMVAIVLSLAVGFLAGGSLELTAFTLVGGLVASLSLYRVEKLNAFLRAGAYVALANLGVVLAFRLQSGHYDMVGLLTLAAASVVNGGLSASLTLAGFFLLGNVFGITTSLQLMELARPNHPLFQQLLLKAPGTYHHSIIVSNMAEQAAEQIDADPLLARVGAYYHDIGKILRPYFFVENQMDKANAHEGLDPNTSAQIVIAHAKDGLELARKYRLPQRIRDIIAQHHGTTLATYFYHQACQSGDEEGVCEEGYRYPGPKPQTREAAIVMLADEVEAAVRANRPSSPEEIERLVRKIINDRLLRGELDECDLTLRDLDKIKSVFTNILQGIFHPRIKYPEEAGPDELSRLSI